MKKIISLSLIIVLIAALMPLSVSVYAKEQGQVLNLPTGWETECYEAFTFSGNAAPKSYASPADVTTWVYKDVSAALKNQPVTFVKPPFTDKDSSSFTGSGEYASFTINKSAEIYIAFGGGTTSWDTGGQACISVKPPSWTQTDGWEEIYIDTSAKGFGEHNGILAQGSSNAPYDIGGRIFRPYKKTFMVPAGKTQTVSLKGCSGGSNITLPYIIIIKWLDNESVEGGIDWPKTQSHWLGYSMAHLKPKADYTSDENPPSFIWHTLHGIGNHISYKASGYDLKIARDKEMTDVYKFVEDIPEHFYNFSAPFEAGVYYWQVRFKRTNPDTGAYEISKWTTPSRFRIDEDANKVYFENINGDAVLNRLKEKTHPYYYNEEKVKEAIKDENRNQEYKNAFSVYKNAAYALPEIDLEMEWEEGLGGNLVRDAFITQMNKEGERLRKLSLVYIGTDDEAVKEETSALAKETVLRISKIKWPPFNSLTDSYIGEMLYSLAVGYDSFYNVLGEEYLSLLKEDYNYLLDLCNSNLLHANDDTYCGFIADPTSSHQMQIGVYMITSALLFRDDVEGTKEIYDFLLPLYVNNYPTYTTDDGLYMNGVGYYKWGNSPELYDVLNQLGICDITKKTKNINEIDQSLYMWPVGSWGPFGDASYSQYDIYQKDQLRAYYDTYNSPVARWMLEEGGLGLGDGKLLTPMGDAKAQKPITYSSSKYFKDAGMAGLHSDLTEKNRVSLFFRSSQWGSYNHSHADQNSFTIDAYGERLAIDSGFYPYYQSPHHKNYTVQTHAHNSITYGDGKGQWPFVASAKGKITSFLNHPDFDLVSGDATLAYRQNGNLNSDTAIDKFARNIIFVRPDCFIVIDDLDAKGDEKTKFQFWLNAEEKIDLNSSKNGATIVKGKAQLDADVLYPLVTGEKLEGFMGYDKVSYPKEVGNSATDEIDENQPNQQRVYFETEEVSKTKMVTLLDVHKTDEEKKFVAATNSDECLRLVFEDGTRCYVQTGENKKVTFDNITFDGDAAVLKDNSVMLVSGTYLEKDGRTLFESDVKCSMVFGKDEFSVSTLENDANVKLYSDVEKVLNKRHESIREVFENQEKFGIKWTKDKSLAYSEFSLYNDNYRFYLNDKILPGTKEKITFTVYIDGERHEYIKDAYIEQDGVLRCDLKLDGIFGDFEIIENSGTDFENSGKVFIGFDKMVETTGRSPYIKLKRIPPGKSTSSMIDLKISDGKVIAEAIVENKDESKNALPVLYIVQTVNSKVVDVFASSNQIIKPNEKQFVSASANYLEGADVVAYIWNRTNNSPIAEKAFYKTEESLIKEIMIDGKSFSDFKADVFQYNITLNKGAVVPVLSASPAHGGVFVTTKYSFTDGSSTAKAELIAKDGYGAEKIYTFNFYADGALLGHISDFKDYAGGMGYEEYYEYSWGKAPEGDKLTPPEDTAKHKGPLKEIPRLLLTTFKQEAGDSLVDSAYRTMKLVDISKASGFENAYFLRPTLAYTWWNEAPEWMYRAFMGKEDTFPKQKVLWYSFKVNAPCEVTLLVDKGMTLGFAEEDASFKKYTLSESVYKGENEKGEDISRNTIMYTRKYNKGDTVYLYNLYGSLGELSMSPDSYMTVPYMTLIKF